MYSAVNLQIQKLAGITENEAKSNNIPYEKGEFPWVASGKVIKSTVGLKVYKIIFNPKQRNFWYWDCWCKRWRYDCYCLAIEMGADAEDIGLTISPHPTLSNYRFIC